jgi:hypothetical protein
MPREVNAGYVANIALDGRNPGETVTDFRLQIISGQFGPVILVDKVLESMRCMQEVEEREESTVWEFMGQDSKTCKKCKIWSSCLKRK